MAFLEGEVALVTGANNPRGIGAAIARMLAREGARVAVHGHCGAPDATDDDAAGDDAPGEALYARLGRTPPEAVARELRASGAVSVALEGDLGEPGCVERILEEATAALGEVTLLINNAAAWCADTFVPWEGDLVNPAVELWTDRPAPLTDVSAMRLFAVNARAPAVAMRAFAQRHLERGGAWGRIVNISTAGSYVFPSEVSYGASKLALEGYTRSAAKELARFGVTVNAILPGPVQTGWITPELEAHILPTIPAGRVGTPEDIARTVRFLVGRDADWITGQCLHVGGGHSM